MYVTVKRKYIKKTYRNKKKENYETSTYQRCKPEPMYI